MLHCPAETRHCSAASWCCSSRALDTVAAVRRALINILLLLSTNAAKSTQRATRELPQIVSVCLSGVLRADYNAILNDSLIQACVYTKTSDIKSADTRDAPVGHPRQE